MKHRILCRVADRLDTITAVRHGTWRALLGLPRSDRPQGSWVAKD